MKILGLQHANITVPTAAVQAAREFYCGVLGLPEIEKPASLQHKGGFWLMAGGDCVHVGVEDGIDRQRTKAHLAYHVDDLPAWRRRLAEHGITAVESIPIEGFDRFEFRDPFGNRVEFIASR